MHKKLTLSHIRQNTIKYCFNFLNKHINFKMGALSGFITGSIVFGINIGFGFWPAFASLCKQFVFNLFMAGYNTRSCEKLAKYIKHNTTSLILGSAIPTLQAFLILFAIHYFGGTPKPMASTLWQVPFNLLIFLCFTLIYRNIINIKKPSTITVVSLLRVKSILPLNKINNSIKRRKQAS